MNARTQGGDPSPGEGHARGQGEAWDVQTLMGSHAGLEQDREVLWTPSDPSPDLRSHGSSRPQWALLGSFYWNTAGDF